MEEKALNDAVRSAREEGIFQGQILATLNDIKRTLDEMRDKHARQETKIDMKVDREEFKDLSKKVEDLQKKVYIGVGILIVFQIIIGFVK